jgi:SAM-dependent methyltransferase
VEREQNPMVRIGKDWLRRMLPPSAKRVLRRLVHTADVPRQYLDLIERADALSRLHEQELVRITAELRNRLLELEARVVELAANRFRSAAGSPAPVGPSAGRYLDHVAGRRRLLELDCGDGQALRIARAQGIEGMGVERDPGLAERARAIGLNVIVADPLDALTALEPGQVDAIVTRAATRDLVARAFAVLPAGGLLVLELGRSLEKELDLLRDLGFARIEVDPERAGDIVVRAHKSS